MVARGSAAPPTPWSQRLAQPTIDKTAYIHPVSNIIGDVRVGANVLIAPGTSIRADEGGPFHIGQGSNLQDGVVVHGLEQGRVVGDDETSYSVWIGENTSITHMALIHGPAYVGNHCFIGFRSTVFNARIGDGCIVMMHALIQDVAVPPGKYVPSGSVITSQQQADRLPDVQAADQAFAAHVVGINQALRSGYHCADTVTCITPIRQQLEKSFNGESAESPSPYSPSSQSHSNTQMVTTHLSPEVVEHVRQLLAQGLKIGSEHADRRRFQTSSWHSCAPIQSSRDTDALAELERCVAEHADEYVRVFGIDTRTKRRVSELIIQRPGESALSSSTRVTAPSRASNGYSSPSPSYGATPSSSTASYGSSSTGLSPEAIERVRYFISQGYKVGTEHADTRHFRTSSWYTCQPIQSNREGDVIQALEGCLAEHAGEYVRLFGIDTKSKRRIAELIIQRPGDSSNGQTAPSPSYTAPSNQSYSHSAPSYSSNGNGNGHLSSDVTGQIRNLISQGYRISTEHADARRFQTSSWKTCAPIQASNESGVMAAVEACMAENSGEYVRVVGIDPKAKRRVAELIVQRP